MSRVLSSGTRLDDGPILVTGAAGFVGRHLMYELEMREGDFCTDLEDSFDAPPGVVKLAWRLPGGEAPAALSVPFRYVVHLAGASSVAHSGLDAAGMYSVNTAGTAALLEWASRACPGARIVLAGSSEVYGSSPGKLPESSPLQPRSPYGGSKAAAESAAWQFRRSHGLDVVVARLFPHFGPWQADRFALPSFCRRMIETRRSGAGWIAVGNLAPVRDYTYIGDVVEAYALLLSRGKGGSVYNVCSGEGRSIAEILELMMTVGRCHVELRPDPALTREADIAVQTGDPSRLAALGWRRRYPFEEGLRILFDWWEERI